MKGSMRQREAACELKVYLGRDPVSGKERYATKSERCGKREAQRALNEMVVEADRGQMARSNATVGEDHAPFGSLNEVKRPVAETGFG